MQKYNPDDFDFTRLTEQESKLLQTQLNKKSPVWVTGMACATLPLVYLVMTFVKHGNPGTVIIILLSLQIIVFAGLSIWAMSWSTMASVLLLVWHLISNFDKLIADRTMSKVIYILFAVMFLFGTLGCQMRKKLIKKASKNNPPPLAEPRI